MSSTTMSRPLIGQAADDLENDGDTEESGSSDDLKENSPSDSEQTGSHDKEPLSMKRRIAFVGALLLCVFTVFAFAFLLPCHKPKCQKLPSCPGTGDLSSINWTEKFSGITPRRISLVDVTGDGRTDILVEFEIEERESMNSSFLNRLCKSKNCYGSGVLAIDGSCGNTLWILSRNSSFGLLACERMSDGQSSNRHCLLPEEKIKLLLFNVGNGTAKWQSKSPSSEKISSFEFANDVNGDNTRDIVFVDEKKNDGTEGDINLLSGKTGNAIGSSLPLPHGHDGSSVLAIHTPSTAHQFVIVGSVSKEKKNSSLWAMSLHDLLEKVRDPMKEFSGESWGKHQPDPQSGFIPIIKDSLIPVQPLLTDLDGDSVKDIVFLIRENGTSLLARNGSDLTVMWKTALPSDGSIHKLLQSQHLSKENSSDVVVFIEYANHSSSLLVIDGPTGKLSFIFHSKSGLPVAPVPVPSVLGMPQAFVIWLPKVESKVLIPKEQAVSQIQQESFDDQNNGSRSADGHEEHNKMPRRKRHIDDDVISESDHAAFSEWKYLHKFFHYDDDNDDDEVEEEDVDSDDDYDDGDDYGEAFNEPDLGLEDDTYSVPLSQETFFDKDIQDKVDNVLEKELHVFHERVYSKKPAFPVTVAEINPQKERFDVMADPDFDRSELEWELSDLTTGRDHEPTGNHEKKVVIQKSSQKNDKILSSASNIPEILSSLQRKAGASGGSQKSEDITVRGKAKNDILAAIQKKEMKFSNHDNDDTLRMNHEVAANAFVPRVHSIPKTPFESTGENIEAEVQEASMSDMMQNNPFLTESDEKENSDSEPVKKPSYHKRSVQGSVQCTQGSHDDADTYVALLLLRGSHGGQNIAEITEEKPLYLGAMEYESLFSIKGDGKLTPCLWFLPRLMSEPVIRETEEGLDLVYSVSFVSEDLSLHIGKVRKISMEQVFERLKSKKIVVKNEKRQSKRESNNNYYSFSFPRNMK